MNEHRPRHRQRDAWTCLGCDSLAVGELPDGCRLCDRGAKLVLLVTGRCEQGCYYCPLSEGKRGRDIVYANERPLDLAALPHERLIEAVTTEATAMRAQGAGITGGDPLSVPDRTELLIEALKRQFGERFHIHLYTAGRVEPTYMVQLARTGLDEIRFHPPPRQWYDLDNAPVSAVVAAACETTMSVGLEVPAIPCEDRGLLELIRFADRIGADFVNLNELEVAETNECALLQRGFHLDADSSAAIAGSQALAVQVIGALEAETELTLHYCSAAYKDAIQLRNRLIRQAQNTHRAYETLTDDGTLLLGEIGGPEVLLEVLARRLSGQFRVPSTLFRLTPERGRIEIAPWLLETLYPFLPGRLAIVEEYPTWDRLTVEKIPMAQWLELQKAMEDD